MKRCGFTLLELLVAVAIIAFLAMILWPLADRIQARIRGIPPPTPSPPESGFPPGEYNFSGTFSVGLDQTVKVEGKLVPKVAPEAPARQ